MLGTSSIALLSLNADKAFNPGIVEPLLDHLVFQEVA